MAEHKKADKGEVRGTYIVEEYVNTVGHAGWHEWSHFNEDENTAKRVFDIIVRSNKNKTMRLVKLVV
jgi:hypothetical protein